MFSHGCLSYNEKMKAQHCEKTLCRASLILQYAILVTSSANSIFRICRGRYVKLVLHNGTIVPLGQFYFQNCRGRYIYCKTGLDLDRKSMFQNMQTAEGRLVQHLQVFCLAQIVKSMLKYFLTFTEFDLNHPIYLNA